MSTTHIDTDNIVTLTAVTEVTEYVEKDIRRTWSNRGFNGWWLNSDHRINVSHHFYPEVFYLVGDYRRPHTMAKIVGARSYVHAIATWEMHHGTPLDMMVGE